LIVGSSCDAAADAADAADAAADAADAADAAAVPNVWYSTEDDGYRLLFSDKASLTAAF
jgi:hypothetical protein